MDPVLPGTGLVVPVNLQGLPQGLLDPVAVLIVAAGTGGMVIAASRQPDQDQHAPILPEAVQAPGPGMITLHAAAKQLLIPVAALLQVHISMVVPRDIIGMVVDAWQAAMKVRVGQILLPDPELIANLLLADAAAVGLITVHVPVNKLHHKGVTTYRRQVALQAGTLILLPVPAASRPVAAHQPQPLEEVVVHALLVLTG